MDLIKSAKTRWESFVNGDSQTLTTETDAIVLKLMSLGPYNQNNMANPNQSKRSESIRFIQRSDNSVKLSETYAHKTLASPFAIQKLSFVMNVP